MGKKMIIDFKLIAEEIGKVNEEMEPIIIPRLREYIFSQQTQSYDMSRLPYGESPRSEDYCDGYQDACSDIINFLR